MYASNMYYFIPATSLTDFNHILNSFKLLYKRVCPHYFFQGVDGCINPGKMVAAIKYKKIYLVSDATNNC